MLMVHRKIIKTFGLFCLCCFLSAPLLAEARLAPTDMPAPPAMENYKTSLLSSLDLVGKIVKKRDTATHTCLLAETAQGKVWLILAKADTQGNDAPALRIWIPVPPAASSANPLWGSSQGPLMDKPKAQALWHLLEQSVFDRGTEQQQAQSAIAAASSHPGEIKTQGMSFAEALEAERARAASSRAIQVADSESSGSAGAVVPPSAGVRVEKASGANSYSVQECFARAKELQGKTVRVRGKVMKVSPMIMGKNWLHIQDGSGDPAKNHHDLVVTSLAQPAVQSIVTVEGILRANRDFGAGYVYETIVEDAKIEQQ